MNLHVINDKINEISLKIEHAKLDKAGKVTMAYLNFKKENLLRKRYKILLEQETIEDRKRINKAAARDARKACQIRYGISTEAIKKQVEE